MEKNKIQPIKKNGPTDPITLGRLDQEDGCGNDDGEAEEEEEDEQDDEVDSCCPRCRLEWARARGLQDFGMRNDCNESSLAKFQPDSRTSDGGKRVQRAPGCRRLPTKHKLASGQATCASAQHEDGSVNCDNDNNDIHKLFDSTTQQRGSHGQRRVSMGKINQSDAGIKRIQQVEQQQQLQANTSESPASVVWAQPTSGADRIPPSARRYSSALWRAVSGGSSGSLNTDDLSGSSIPPQFQLNRDLIREAAKRLGRRLSLGGTTILGRLFTVSGDQQQQNLIFVDNAANRNGYATSLASAAPPSVAMVAPKTGPGDQTKKVLCDIRLEKREDTIGHDDDDDGDNQDQGRDGLGRSEKKDGHEYPVTDVMNLFCDDEFARRHRQSIAVQTFFTKSIEVNADEEEELEMGANNANNITNSNGGDRKDEEDVTSKLDQFKGQSKEAHIGQQQQPPTEAEVDRKGWQSEDYAPSVGLEDDDHDDDDDDQLMVDNYADQEEEFDTTTSGWTPPTSQGTTGRESISTANGRSADRSQSASHRSNGGQNYHQSHDKQHSRKMASSRCNSSSRQQDWTTNAEGGDEQVKARCHHGHHVLLASNSDELAMLGRMGDGKAGDCAEIRARRCRSSTSHINKSKQLPFDCCYARAASASASASAAAKLDPNPPANANISRKPNEFAEQQSNSPGPTMRSKQYGNQASNAAASASASAAPAAAEGHLSESDVCSQFAATGILNSGQHQHHHHHHHQQQQAGMIMATNDDHDDDNNNNNKLDRINSDFSSFTLITTNSTPNNNTSQATTSSSLGSGNALGGGKGDLFKRSKYAKPGRRLHETELHRGNHDDDDDEEEEEEDDDDDDGGSGNRMHQIQGQRRAFSETEAYGACSRGFPVYFDGNSGGGANHAKKVAEGGGLAHRLGELPPSASSGDAAMGPFGRQIKSAEPTNYNTVTNSSSTISSSNLQNDDPRGRRNLAHLSYQYRSTDRRIETTSNLNNNNINDNNATITRVATTSTTSTTTGTSTNGNGTRHHNSLTNLIDEKQTVGQHAYVPLNEQVHHPYHHHHQPHPLEPLARVRSSGGGGGAGGGGGEAVGASAGQGGVSSPSRVAKYQQQQWCNSNTFSSSINSDISTSGPKDTTEKDSSRRTSTLSGISSIYQQETSLGLATPYSSYGAGNSTPCNSQAAACSNMGSIPELATVPDQGAPLQQQQQQQQQAQAYHHHPHPLNPYHHPHHLQENQQQHRQSITLPSSDLESSMQRTFIRAHDPQRPPSQASSSSAEDKLSSQPDTARNSASKFDSSAERNNRTELKSGENFAEEDESPDYLAATSSRVADSAGGGSSSNTSGDLFDNQQAATAATNNLQRKAQSLRSQLRERLSTMIPLNALIGSVFENPPGTIDEEPPTTPSGSGVFTTEGGWQRDTTTSSIQPPPIRSAGGGNQLRATTTTFGFEFPTKQQTPSSPTTTSSAMAPTKTTNAHSQPNTPIHMRSSNASKNETPTPASFRSFFRSTSSAAFNAFASSFQHQSSSISTPTGTTVLTQHFSSSSSQHPFGSLSSDKDVVFDSPAHHQTVSASTSIGSPSLMSSPQVKLPHQQQQQQPLNEDVNVGLVAGGAGPRSPLSPISVTSTRFFARIRDKFSLSPVSSGVISQTRPTSSLSNSASTSPNITVVGNFRQAQYYQDPSAASSHEQNNNNNDRQIGISRQAADRASGSQGDRGLWNDRCRLPRRDDDDDNNKDKNTLSSLSFEELGVAANGAASADPQDSGTKDERGGGPGNQVEDDNDDYDDSISLHDDSTNNSGIESTSNSMDRKTASSSEIVGAESTSSSRKGPKLHRKQHQTAQKNHQALAGRKEQRHYDGLHEMATGNTAVTAAATSRCGLRTNLADSYEDYDYVVSSRRPSFQRQLDEQVNQVYRMAVERKLLQNSPMPNGVGGGGDFKLADVQTSGGAGAANLQPTEATAAGGRLGQLGGNCSPVDKALFAESNSATGNNGGPPMGQGRPFPVSQQHHYQANVMVGSNLSSIIRSASGAALLAANDNNLGLSNPQASAATSIYHPYPYHYQYQYPSNYDGQQPLPSSEIGPRNPIYVDHLQQQQQPQLARMLDNRQWMESSQQSIDSSSSARSLRSCWFSMPELYAMNRDSNSQSPSGILQLAQDPAIEGQQGIDTMDQLLGALTSLGPADKSQQQQPNANAVGQDPIEWPSNQLYKQLTSDGGHNWSLSDLNLTSDDIAPPQANLMTSVAPSVAQVGAFKEEGYATSGGSAAIAPIQATTSDSHLPPAPSNQDQAFPQADDKKQQPLAGANYQMIKCSTLDDSICVSMKSNSSHDNNNNNNNNNDNDRHDNGKLRAIGCSSLDNNNQKQPLLNELDTATLATASRPTSQNSTISSTSCALSDFNSSELQELRSPVSQQQPWTTGLDSTSLSVSPINVSPLSSNTSNQPPPEAHQVASPLQHQANLLGQLPVPPPPSPIPQCMITTDEVTSADTGSKQQQEVVASAGDKALLLLGESSLTAAIAQSKQRAMSLVPMAAGANLQQQHPGQNASSNGGGGGDGGGNASLQAPINCGPRRRSAMGNLLPSADVAPAAVTLDLRLASRKNRVKLTDLHPITFMNDKKFLNSMSSLKKAGNNKLDAIFNSPVGRRLSINAELAQQQAGQNGQHGSKSGIKIGLTGYVYFDRHDNNNNNNNQQGSGWLKGNDFQRRPSLAPNFWRAQHNDNNNNNSADNDGRNPNASGGGTDSTGGGLLTPSNGFRSRPRAASCTPATASASDMTTEPTTPACKGTTDTLELALSAPVNKPQQAQRVAGGSLSWQRPATGVEPGSVSDSGASSGKNVPPLSFKPPSGYNFEKRRSTMALLERLSESSIELDGSSAFPGSTGSGSGSNPITNSSLLGTRPSRRSTSCLLKIGEDEELKPDCKLLFGQPIKQQQFVTRKSLAGAGHRNYTRAGASSSPPPSSSSDDQQQQRQPEAAARDNRRREEDNDDSSSDGGCNGGNNSSSSSDDGDIDKLVAQYSVVGDPQLEVYRKSRRGPQHTANDVMRHRSKSSCQTTTSSQPSKVVSHNSHFNSDKIVENEMILRQLLLATNVASMETSGKLAPTARAEMRRFSAINLYQRDEDVFVANSMKRPPASQIQALNTLPLLAGTLPILVQGSNNCQQQQPLQQTLRTNHNQLPLLPGGRTGVKSIITGNSGLNKGFCGPTTGQSNRLTMNNSEATSALNIVGKQQQQQQRAGLINSAMVAEVDVEEQLNRLRQQEKRSMAYGLSTGSTGGVVTNANKFGGQQYRSQGSSERQALEEDEDGCDLGDVEVPSSLTIPAILQPPESSEEAQKKAEHTIDLELEEKQKRLHEQRELDRRVNELVDDPSGGGSGSQPKIISLPANRFTIPPLPPVKHQQQQPSSPKSPVKSRPLSPTNQLVTATTVAVGSAPTSPPGSSLLVSAGRSDPLAYSGSKSCEPFKQLDTIIEGRGLLLGAEQQANPEYTNCLRRLSGNHSRRSSLGNGSGQQSAAYDDGDWCKCDSMPSHRRRLSSLKGGQVNGDSNNNGLTRGKEERCASDKLNTSGDDKVIDATAGVTTSSSSSISTSSKYVLDTMKSLARRTLNNLTTISGPILATPNPSASQNVAASGGRASSTSMIGPGCNNWSKERPIVQSPSLSLRVLREQVKARVVSASDMKQKPRQHQQQQDHGLNEHDEEELSTSSSITGSPDDSSLISLDDAENYRTKNKENKMKHGRSLESSSSSLSSSSSTISATLEELDAKRDGTVVITSAGFNTEQRGDIRTSESQQEAVNNNETLATRKEDEEEEEEETEQPKICYKCNKRIRIESFYYVDGNYGEEEEDYEDEDTEYYGEEGEEDDYEDDKEDGLALTPEDELGHSEVKSAQNPEVGAQGGGGGLKRSQRTTLAASSGAGGGGGTGKHRASGHQAARGHHHGGRRCNSTAARRSASINATDSELTTTSGQHINRRKNKWHIQRNLAPKLKRQRSFSANYAPEVPNPMMPPQRRFSAAPNLTCPHRNKSSSPSSSSIYQTYSIDSSESMITVIPSNRGIEFKRTSRGSLSCNSSGQGMDSSGSFYALPRSPLSPRSPSRCSPGMLTPNTSEPPTILEPPFSPTTTTCSSTGGPTTVIAPQQQTFSPTLQHQHPSNSTGDSRSSLDGGSRNQGEESLNQVSITSSAYPNIPNLSLTPDASCVPKHQARLPSGADESLENSSHLRDSGTTSCYSSKQELQSEELAIDDDGDGFQFDTGSKIIGGGHDDLHEAMIYGPDTLVIRERINDMCARHSKEELELLIGQIGSLRISDCYFSEKSSSLCMVIEVMDY